MHLITDKYTKDFSEMKGKRNSPHSSKHSLNSD